MTRVTILPLASRMMLPFLSRTIFASDGEDPLRMLPRSQSLFDSSRPNAPARIVSRPISSGLMIFLVPSDAFATGPNLGSGMLRHRIEEVGDNQGKHDDDHQPNC